MRILVVDDDPAILRLCAAALRTEGHEVVPCDAGQRALTRALVEKFDLALCDINLPDIDGLDVVRAIKMQAPDLPVIVISALDPREWRAKSMDAGADHFLQKPIRLDVLRNEVAMADLARASMTVALCDRDDGHRARLYDELKRNGCSVVVVEEAAQIVELGKRPDLVILDAGDEHCESVVRWAGREGVHCFVLVDPETSGDRDDGLMRAGASLIVQKPVDPQALVLQARFLATHPR
jgi:DNA-binding response OmpR family regulator